MSNLLRAYDRSRVPLYIQVASVMRQRIQSGYWLPGQKISNLDELEREFQVARVTVRQAVELLSVEGLLHAQQGRGTFVADKTPDRHWLKLATTWENLIASVRDNVPHRIAVEVDAPNPTLSASEGRLAAGYVHLRSVQYRDNEPYSVVNLLLARSIYDRAPDRFLAGAALPVVADLGRLDVRTAHQTFVIGSADPETADALMVPLGAPTVDCHCVLVDGHGTAIYVADINYRSDCIKLQIDLLAQMPESRKSRAAPAPPDVRGRTVTVDPEGQLVTRRRR